jgi:hypothetical protein
LVNIGDLDAATFLSQTEVVGLAVDGVEMFRRSPVWTSFTERTRVFVRELDALDKLMPTGTEAERIKAKTWLLIGDQTWPQIRTAAAGVVSIVKGLTVYPIVGQHHMAYSQDPGIAEGYCTSMPFRKTMKALIYVNAF